MAERAHVRPARVAERADEQEHLYLAAGDLYQPLTEVDLELLAGWRLEAHRGKSLGTKLLAIGFKCALHCPATGNTALLGQQLLAHHIAITAMLAQTLEQPILEAFQQPFALGLLVGLPAAGFEITPHCPSVDT